MTIDNGIFRQENNRNNINCVVHATDGPNNVLDTKKHREQECLRVSSKREYFEPERSSPVKLLPDLGLEETTSREFTGCEGRGAIGVCTDLRGAIEGGRVGSCEDNRGSTLITKISYDDLSKLKDTQR